MKQYIQAGKFKTKCLKIMDNVRSTGHQIIITKRNVPIAKLCPIDPPDISFFGRMRGTVHELGNLIEPIGENWNADY